MKDRHVEIRDYIAGEHNWHDYQAHERAVRNHKYLYIRNAFPKLNASPPADAVGSITYQEMIKLYKAGKLNENQLDCFVKPRLAEELFDVVNDPDQLRNLASDPEYTNVLDEMRNLLDSWIVEYGDKIPEHPSPDTFDRWTGKRLN
nr:hypothetical protein [Sunxiuqinia sp.]